MTPQYCRSARHIFIFSAIQGETRVERYCCEGFELIEVKIAGLQKVMHVVKNEYEINISLDA